MTKVIDNPDLPIVAPGLPAPVLVRKYQSAAGMLVKCIRDNADECDGDFTQDADYLVIKGYGDTFTSEYNPPIGYDEALVIDDNGQPRRVNLDTHSQALSFVGLFGIVANAESKASMKAQDAARTGSQPTAA